MKTVRGGSSGVRNPTRNAALFGVASIASIVLVTLGATDMRETGRSGSPLLMLGLFPALLCPIVLVHYLRMIRVFRNMYSGRSAIARWTMPFEQFERFREQEQRNTDGRTVNFYKLPDVTPAKGVDIIFSSEGVLIGGGYFPLLVTRGRRVQDVRYSTSNSPFIEFAMVLTTLVRTSSATTNTARIAQVLRIPVSTDAAMQAVEVVHRYRVLITGR